MTLRRTLLFAPAFFTLAALTACASPTGDTAPTPATSTSTDDAGHGARAGATEVAEPPLALMAMDATGAVGTLDLLTGETAEIGSIAAPTAVQSDGRYVFASTADGLAVVDSGRWSWDHGDHFHYYLAATRVIGTVAGQGAVEVTSGMLSTAGSTGVFFEDSGEAVLLDNAALSDGEIVELFRIETGASSGIVAPLDKGALVTEGDELVFYDATGAPVGGATECVDASGAITTRVGLVVGCADGAILATWQDGAPVFERIDYPEGADAERATSFDGRKGRPTVAALAGTSGFWLLDSRKLSWRFIETAVPLARVSAVDDADGHVVAVDTDGRLRVYLADSGAEAGVTDPLVGAVTPSVSLWVDGQRAYVNDPDAGVVHEIDYADAARVARTLETPTAPQLVAEVGR